MIELNQYQKGFIGGVAGCIQAILEECEEEIVDLISEK